MSFIFNTTAIDGLYVITPHIYEDFRGAYQKNYERNTFLENGISATFSESSDLFSKKGVLRGLHYQMEQSQAKLVHVIKGTVFDVAVDLRYSSSTFGSFHVEILDDRIQRAIYIPENFAHGFLSLTDDSIFSYQCSGK